MIVLAHKSLEENTEALANVIRQCQYALQRPMLVALDGPSGAGKSTLAGALAQKLDAAWIPSDDFFAAEITDEGWNSRTPAERARDAIDWQRLKREALEPLLAGKTAQWFPFDFTAGSQPDGTYLFSQEPTRRAPRPIIILDGAYATRPELAAVIDLTVFVEAPLTVRRQRLANREEPDFLAAWHARWDLAEEWYFTHQRPKTVFDVVVTNGS